MSEKLSPSREKEFKRLQDENIRLKIQIQKLQQKPGKEPKIQPDEFKKKLLSISDKLENALLRIFDLQKENEHLFQQNVKLKEITKKQRQISDVKKYIVTNNRLILQNIRKEMQKEKVYEGKK